MIRWLRGFRTGLDIAWTLSRAGAQSVGAHWGLAVVSLAFAFGVWVLVQDIENPRVEGVVPVPEEQGISVIPVNLPDGYIIREAPTVRVRVEAREEDLPNLRASDFEARIDLLDVPLDEPTLVEVRVTSNRDGVSVLSVEPREVEVTVVQATEKVVEVEYVLVGGLPDGYRIVRAEVEPAFVDVSGLEDLVDRVATVQLEVNLSGVREETFVAEGALVARSASGNTVLARLSQERGRVTFTIEQVFETRTLPLSPNLTGNPAPGYRVVSATVDPPVVTVTGTRADLESLGDRIVVREVSIEGARGEVVQTAEVALPENVLTDRTSVTVTVIVEPQECGGNDAPQPPCVQVSMVLGVQFTDIPAGMAVSTGPYFATVLLSVSLDALAGLAAGDFQAVISLAGASPGTSQFVADVSGPEEIRIDTVLPTSVTLAGN
ncbi:MAG: CdaR family protein [Dehalococcoidia bacterium]